MNENKIDKRNLAIAEITDIIVECLIYNQPVTESLLADNYSAAMSKYGISSKKDYDLVGLLQSTTLKIQQTSFLTSDQKKEYREQLNDTIGALRNPFGHADTQINSIVEQADELKKYINEDTFDKENANSIIDSIQQNIKQIKVANTEEKKGGQFLNFIYRLGTFSGKSIFYGLIFNVTILIGIAISAYINDPSILDQLRFSEEIW